MSGPEDFDLRPDPASLNALLLPLQVSPLIHRQIQRWKLETPRTLFVGWSSENTPHILLIFDCQDKGRILWNFCDVVQQELSWGPNGFNAQVTWQSTPYTGPHLVIC